MTKHFADFVNAQAAFGPALKNKRNSHLKNTYADLESCLEAVTDALHANGFALMQIPKNCDTQSVTIETVFVHASGQIISGGDMRVPVIKTDPQGVGSSLSYARRYSLLAACGIAQADDDGELQRKEGPAAVPDDDPMLAKIDKCATAAALNTLFSSLEPEDRPRYAEKFRVRKAKIAEAA